MHRRMIVPDDSLQRVRSEYMEMPGLRLSLAQAARLLSIDCSACARVLDVLVEAQFLRLTSNGLYVKSDISGRGEHDRRSLMGHGPSPRSHDQLRSEAQ